MFLRAYKYFFCNNTNDRRSLLRIEFDICNGKESSNVLFNPFAPADFAEKRVLKLVEGFSCHCRATKTYHKPVYRSYTSRPSDPDAKYQLAKFGHAPLPHFFFSCWAFSRLRFGGKSF